jgi:hypothetical protein
MSLKDKLEIGLKPDAPYRKDNLPDFQQDDPACDIASTPGDSPELHEARKDCVTPPIPGRRSARPVRKARPERRNAPRRTTTGR